MLAEEVDRKWEERTRIEEYTYVIRSHPNAWMFVFIPETHRLLFIMSVFVGGWEHIIQDLIRRTTRFASGNCVRPFSKNLKLICCSLSSEDGHRSRPSYFLRVFHRHLLSAKRWHWLLAQTNVFLHNVLLTWCGVTRKYYNMCGLESSQGGESEPRNLLLFFHERLLVRMSRMCFLSGGLSNAHLQNLNFFFFLTHKVPKPIGFTSRAV